MENGQIRIGVYICHCGTNIAGKVDCKNVADYVATLPNVVVSREYKYMCSDPGQSLIQKDIEEYKLNRLIVAACSPTLHEKTFRKAAAKAGLNPFYFQMVNIREHNSWVHEDGKEATRKAKDLIRAAVNRVVYHKPLEIRKAPVNPNVLVVGGGIAGIHAALTLANSGKHVYLVERQPTIGGHMAKFDKTFPTLDCAACILTPKMTAVKDHPNITLWTYSEVIKVDGYVGNFKVTIKRKPRYIIEDACVGCLECIEECVYKEPRFPDEFNEGLGKRKPVYLPFPQAVPKVVVIDPETCIELKSGRCKKTCVEACGDRNAIDFTQKEEIKEIEVGTVILATGFKTFDPKRIPYYKYGVYPNVYTALEIERLINASGPTGGEVVLRNGKKPKTVAIIHCVGSRDEKTNRWCSRVCCMYSIKLAHLIKEHTGAEIYNFYIDIRTPGKAFEEFYTRIAQEGVNFIRGKVADIYPEETPDGKKTDRLIVHAENTLLGRIMRVPVDMVVLSTGLEPQADAQQVRRMFNISCSSEGFFLEKHPKLAPVNTATDGIFLAGCCQFPKDIPDTVAQASGAASKAIGLFSKEAIMSEAMIAYINEETCVGCGLCAEVCPFSAIELVEIVDRERSTRENQVMKTVARVNEGICKGCGTCSAGCRSLSARLRGFDGKQILAEIDALADMVKVRR